MDETPTIFDLPSNRTVNGACAKSVLVKTNGHHKSHFTVVLSCLANGSKLPPVIIFKKKTLPKGMKFPSGVLISAQLKGWIDENETIDWLENVWNKRQCGLLKNQQCLLGICLEHTKQMM